MSKIHRSWAQRLAYDKLKRELLKGKRECFYCLAPLSLSTKTVDHMIPIERGGQDEITNLVLCCKPCNQAKDNMTVVEYCEFVAKVGGFEKVHQYIADGKHRLLKRMALSL